MEDVPKTETGYAKLKRRCMQEPFVPIGCLATAGVLTGGLLSFARAADPRTQQKYMRARVFAQGSTVIVMVLGSFLALNPQKK